MDDQSRIYSQETGRRIARHISTIEHAFCDQKSRRDEKQIHREIAERILVEDLRFSRIPAADNNECVTDQDQECEKETQRREEIIMSFGNFDRF